MDFIGNENKLTQAIYKNDWAAVKHICEVEQNLINTYDKHGFTPLIYAVQEHNAPDDVVLQMINKATTELLENEDDAGYTILHLLSDNAYPLSLRCALERSTKHINKRDDDGRTPLHDCLDSPNTYEDHQETALCLIGYGASVIIKDDWGKTPLDLYDDNECSKYDASTRTDKKAALKELLQGKVPLEVLARGLEANIAFTEAIQEGSKRIYQTRLMIVGQERVGKTSLCKSLTNQMFDATEEVTDGIHTSSSYTLSVKQTTNWKQKPTKENIGEARLQYWKAVAEKMAAKLKKKLEKQQPTQHSVIDEIKKLKIDEIEQDIMKKGNGQAQAGIPQPSDQQTLSQGDPSLSSTMDVPEEVVKLVMEILQGKEKESEIKELEEAINELTLSIWDFAGQDMYYTTHQVFLVSRAIYIICFNLCHDLNAPAIVEIYSREGRKIVVCDQHMTNLDFIVFWLRTIYSNTTENTSLSNQKQLSPPVFIVGSHRESLPGNPQEKQAAAEEMFKTIQEKLKGTPYEGHVVSKYYAIDNSLTPLDHSIVELRDHITEVAKSEHYMGQEIPIKWLDFLQEIEELCKDKESINFQEVKDIAAKCGVTKEIQLFTMLHFYHDLGSIIYYGELETPESALNDIVILKPNWLICIFRRVFTVKSQSERWGKFKRSWTRLDEDGILEERLIRHMWYDFIHQLEGLLQLMQKFDLLCEKTKESVSDSPEDGDRLFYAPSMLKRQGDETVCMENLEKCKSVIMLYIDFNGFLPEGLFYRLIVRLLQWSQRKGGYEPKLFHQQANLYVDEDHDMVLRIMPQMRSVIQIAITRASSVGSDGEEYDEDDVEPSPIICKMVLKLMEENLMYLGHTWMKRIDFDFCVLCSICNKKQMIHFHSLTRCLKEKAVPCGIRRMRTSRIRCLFGDYKPGYTGKGGVISAAKEDPKGAAAPVKSFKLPAFLRRLSGEFKEISSPILPFDLMTEICVLLDPPHPLSKDWRALACRLGYDQYIDYLARKDSPTMCVMKEWSDKGKSVEDLKECMVAMNRHDVVRLIHKNESRNVNL